MPSPAGYSGTPLCKKLGIQPGMIVYLYDAPAHYRNLLGDLPAEVAFTTQWAANLAFMHVFVTQSKQLRDRLPHCLRHLASDGVIWVSWPKKASKVPTDVTEDVIRQCALPLGLVDIKVCAVDEVWSGLKLMIRKELRSGKTKATRKHS
jgi:hypothetical protein